MSPLSLAEAELRPLTHCEAMPMEGELHLWYWTASSSHEQALELLDPSEKARYARFATPELKRCFLASHAGMRHILTAYLNTVAADITFLQTAAGKPYLAGTSLRFNLSHSADANLMAVATVEVGVDIERIRKVTSVASLAARHFARPELEAMRHLGDADRSFFATWTRKEAVIKLVGLGLSARVQELDTSANHDAIAVPSSWQLPTNRCWIVDLTIDSEYAAAFAVGDKPHAVRLFRVE